MSSAGAIEKAMEHAGVPALPPGAYERFAAYLDLLLRWNARLNLTAIRTPEGILERHFAECAFAAHQLPSGVSTLLDFGSGAGFPGIPIAICRPEIHVTLAESQQKKAAFLREAARVLEIPLEIYSGRVEGMPPGRTFDCVAMRAVDKMPAAVQAARSRADRLLFLMLARRDAPAYRELAPEFDWLEPISLPGAGNSIVLTGRK